MFHITICGHDSHHQVPFQMEHREGLSHYLLLLVKSPAWFWLDGERKETQPNMFILFEKDTYIHYGYDLPDYNDDWIHFTAEDPGDLAFLSSLGLPAGQPVYLPDLHLPSHYIQLLTNARLTASGHSVEISDSLMRALLCTLSDELSKSSDPDTSHKYYSALSTLRAGLYNEPSRKWTVPYMASLAHLSISYFQHLYKQFFGCSCQQDIIRARLDQARFFLRQSDMSIRNLSAFCGYENELHFMRQFKKFEGMTPSQFRRLHKPSEK